MTVGDPDLIKHVMVKDFHIFHNRRQQSVQHKILGKHMFSSRDDAWKRLRAISSPTFTSGKMRKMYPLIRRCVQDFVDHLQSYVDQKKEIDMKVAHGAFTMDVISKCAFATNVNTHKDPDNLFVKNAQKVFNPIKWRILMTAIAPKFILNYIQFSLNPGASDFFVNAASEMIRQRKTNKIKNNDFLQLLLDVEQTAKQVVEENDKHEAHHVNESEDEKEANEKALSINLVDKKLTEDEIIAQCFLFLIAGYETTASTLAFCSHELALNQQVQDKLYEEIKANCDSKGEISYENLIKLPYLDAVLSETLRLYPPLPKVEREASEDYQLGNTGILMKKGMRAEIPVYAIQHSEEYYEEPEKFNPERFMPENRSNIKPYTYLPFGVGPRNCIGMRFALLEAKLGLFHLLQKYRFVKSKNTDVPLKFLKARFILGAEKIVVGIQQR